MNDVFGLEFRPEQADSPYPFADTATLVADTGFTLDPALFLDASVHPTGGTAGLRLSEVVVTPTAVSFLVGDDATEVLASGSFSPIAPGDGRVRLLDPAGKPAGLLLADPVKLALAAYWPAGTHKFTRQATEFVASCAIYLPPAGVRSLTGEDGLPLSGHVWLVGEDGVVLSVANNEIRVDVAGDPYFVRKLCGPVAGAAPPVLKTINNIAPGPGGTFLLVRRAVTTADSVLRVIPRPPDGIELALAQPAS